MDMYSHNFERMQDVLKRICFDIEIELMRHLMLTQVKEITEGNEAIYLDMDKLPTKDGKQVGEATMPFGILFGDGPSSIIAINNPKNEILVSIIDEVKNKLSKKQYLTPRNLIGCMFCNATSNSLSSKLNTHNISSCDASHNSINIDESQSTVYQSWIKANKKNLYTTNELKQKELDIKKDIIPTNWKNAISENAIPLPWKDSTLNPKTQLEAAALESAMRQGGNMQHAI
ncbi:hypothetical protein [Wolbachia endosymbiont of Pentidionis agamae]|uniref:hypothetical protein n=1 Tax=Wolbachia endosymbiont of Pentidionis agamae TaxID=3110435 RepID=UPI002FD516A0